LAASAAAAVAQWHWNDAGLELPHERVMNTLTTVEVMLGGAVEQTVAVVETCTNDAHCDRFGSIECETWTDGTQCTDMTVAGTDNTGYMPVHTESVWSSSSPSSLTESENWRLYASHINTFGSVRTWQPGCCSEYHCLSVRWVQV